MCHVLLLVCLYILYDNVLQTDRTHSSVWLIGSTYHNKTSPAQTLVIIQHCLCVCARFTSVFSSHWSAIMCILTYMMKGRYTIDYTVHAHTHTHSLSLSLCLNWGLSDILYCIYVHVSAFLLLLLHMSSLIQTHTHTHTHTHTLSLSLSLFTLLYEA